MPSVRCRVLLALMVFTLGVALDPEDALARDTEKSWEFGGYALLSHYASGSNIDNGFGLGARGGYHFKAIHELEGSLDSVSADNASRSGISYDVKKVSVDYLHMFLIKGHEKITPFASFGVGLISVDDGSDSAKSASYRGGGGFKYFFKPRVAFRFDLKIFRWHGDGDVLARDPYFSLDTTFGLAFLVGGSK